MKNSLIKYVFAACVFLYYTLGVQAIESFPEIDGWQIDDEKEIYYPDNLFDYINGAADSYLSYDFKKLEVGRYFKENDKDTYITVELYEHASLTHAYGIYTRERPPEGNFMDIGGQGYMEGSVLNFLVDRYYVKINSHDESNETREKIKTLARQIAENISSEAGMPGLVNCFPEKNKIKNSDSYINKNFLGYGFFKGAFVSSYSTLGNTEVFIMNFPDNAAAVTTLNEYLEFVEHTKEKEEINDMLIPDPYNGEINIRIQDKYLFGAHGYEKEPPTDLLNTLANNLKKENCK